MRPKTLHQVASLVAKGEPFSLLLREFLDEFYLNPNDGALREVPAELKQTHPEMGAVIDAYLAATAEHLACFYNLPTPSWVWQPGRQLHRHWFANEMASLRAILLHESPAAFRSRNLFVSENALSRA